MDLLLRVEAYQKVFLDAARHQVSELIPLNCATAVERPVVAHHSQLLVRFGSLADIATNPREVGFRPNNLEQIC
ncbi:MAG TPA: hypothetical protein VIY07_19175 [Pseudolabrys sp.]